MFSFGILHEDVYDKEEENEISTNYNYITRETEKINEKIMHIENRNDRAINNLKIAFDKIKDLNEIIINKNTEVDNKVKELETKINKLETRVDVIEDKLNSCVLVD